MKFQIIATLAVILLMTYVGYEYFRIKGLVSISSKLIKISTPYQQTPANPTKKLLFIGDSTGVGTGVTKPSQSLAGIIGAKHPDYQIDNMSSNGLRTDGLVELSKEVKGEYDLVVVHIGGNDMIRFKSLDQAEHNIKRSLDNIMPHTKHIALFTTGNLGDADLMPILFRPIYTANSKNLRNRMLSLAQNYENVSYVDLFKENNDLKSVNGYADDKLHLSPEGYKLWHQALVNTLRPAVDIEL